MGGDTSPMPATVPREWYYAPLDYGPTSSRSSRIRFGAAGTTRAAYSPRRLP